MRYSLWDTETSNQFGQYEDKAEVLTLVRALVRHYGEGYAEGLSLGRINEKGKVLKPLPGAALLARIDEVLGDRHQEESENSDVVGHRLAANA
jgi:hypothetical protein